MVSAGKSRWNDHPLIGSNDSWQGPFFADSSTKPCAMSGFRKSAQNGGKRSAAQTPPLA